MNGSHAPLWPTIIRAECALTNALHAARDAMLVSDWSFEAGGNWVVIYSDGTVSGRPLLGTVTVLSAKIRADRTWQLTPALEVAWRRLLNRMECLAEECVWWEVA